MHLKSFRTGAVVVASILAGCLATAGEPRPGTEEPDQGFGAYGPGSQHYWIAATQFAPNDGAVQWTEGDLYYHNASPSAGVYKAQVELPAGAAITLLDCLFYDASPNEGAVTLRKYQYDYVNDFPTFIVNYSTVTTTGTAGYQRPSGNLNNLSVLYREGNYRNIYTLVAQMPPADPNVRLRGCRLVWHRSVSVAPAAATFDDVPTTHSQFRFVEALAAAGITGGCGASSFCPNAPLTRGQMAVFLAAALGLHFPY